MEVEKLKGLKSNGRSDVGCWPLDFGNRENVIEIQRKNLICKHNHNLIVNRDR